jgi:hypothetical protein
MNHTFLKILNPVGILNFKPMSPAKRLADLHKKKIGLYWNRKARGNVALDRVKEILSKKYEGLTFEWFETPISTEASQEWFENVRKKGVHGVVGATGD